MNKKIFLFGILVFSLALFSLNVFANDDNITYSTCRNENMQYWTRDGECGYSCGASEDEFMISKGWTKVDYDCFRFNEPQLPSGGGSGEEGEINLEDAEIIEYEEEPIEEQGATATPVESDSGYSTGLKVAVVVIVIIVLILFAKWYMKDSNEEEPEDPLTRREEETNSTE